jgi:hypothetical protein
VVTDFSGIAHDSLLLGIPTVSVLIDFDNYRELCPSLIDQDQMDVSYVVNEIEELVSKIELAIGPDPIAGQRSEYVDKIVSGLGALPGVNTREEVLAALDS